MCVCVCVRVLASQGFGRTVTTTIRRSGYALTLYRMVFTHRAIASADALVQALVVADDGAVVYLNGVEADRRENMPQGALTSRTLASSAKSMPAAAQFTAPMYWPANTLVAGSNVIAVARTWRRLYLGPRRVFAAA